MSLTSLKYSVLWSKPLAWGNRLGNGILSVARWSFFGQVELNLLGSLFIRDPRRQSYSVFAIY
jgi:hypothetical protein